MAKTPETLVSQQLFQAIEEAIEAGWSINRIAEEAGISRPSLQYWYSGARSSLAIETVNALCQFLGMRLSKPRIPNPGDEIRAASRKPKAKAAKRKGK